MLREAQRYAGGNVNVSPYGDPFIPGDAPGPPTLRVGVLRERCSLVWLSRVSAIQPSFAACGSGPPLRLGRTASNRMFTGHSVVEPRGFSPSALRQI